MLPTQPLENTRITSQQFIAANCKASVLRVFPGEYLDLTVQRVLDDARAGNRRAQTARKLLLDSAYRK
jgi:hypothetical protein